MTVYDRLYEVYARPDSRQIRELQVLVDLFPPLDSPIALGYWEDARDRLFGHIQEITRETGEPWIADILAKATREEAFTAADLAARHGRPIDTLVLDVDETLRSAGTTDNEIPRETLYHLTELHEQGVPIIICTGQTLENVKGFAIQGLGTAIAHSETFSIVYESGTGVFSPGHGSATKRLLYEELEPPIPAIFTAVRSRILTEAPPAIAEQMHLQGNEFNVTLKPNFDVGTTPAAEIVIDGMHHLMETVGAALAEQLDGPHETAATVAAVKRWFAERDSEIAAVLEARDEAVPEVPIEGELESVLQRLDIAIYPADAAELSSLDLNKAHGVQAALEILEIPDPFLLVMGDSKSDLRVMQWVDETGAGIAAAPRHASAAVLDHVYSTDALVFEPGDAASILRTVDALRRLIAADQVPGELRADGGVC